MSGLRASASMSARRSARAGAVRPGRPHARRGPARVRGPSAGPPDHAEHDSDEIWRAVAAAVRGAVAAAGASPSAVVGLAFDATCSLVMHDGAGRPVSVSTTGEDRWNVVMWADHRATAEAREITATGHRALDYVGGVMSPEMELPKLLWLKRHLPGSWERFGLAQDLADFLTWRATGDDRRLGLHRDLQVDLPQPREPGAGRPTSWRRSASAGLLAKLRVPARRGADRRARRLARRARRGRPRPGARDRGRRRIDRRPRGRARPARRSLALGPERPAGADRRHVELPHGPVAGAASRPGRLGSRTTAPWRPRSG